MNLSKRGWYIALVFTMILWGTMHVPFKLLANAMSTSSLTFLRFSLAALALLPFVWKDLPKIEKQDYKHMIGLGIIGIALYGWLNTLGISLSNASNNAVLVNTWPLFIVIIAPLLVKEHVNKQAIFGSILGFVGVVLVVTGGNFSDLLGETFLRGNLVILLSASMLAIFSTYAKSFISKYGGLVVTFSAVLVGSVILMFAMLFNGTTSEIVNLSSSQWLAMLYFAIPTTAFTWYMRFKGIEVLGLVKLSSMFFLIPLSGVTTSVILLGETLSAGFIVGSVIIIVGVYIVQKARLEVR